MGILAECPICRKKQSNKNKSCPCGEDLAKAKRSKRVRYWIDFYIPGGKQRRESVGYSIEEARAAMGKRLSQKKEGRIFDMLPEADMTFNEVTKWYLSLTKVMQLKSWNRVEIALKRFNEVFGDKIINDVKNIDLEDYQSKRESQGISPRTIDMELSITQTMITKAFDNDLLDGKALKSFRRTDHKLKKGTNARDRTVSVVEYLELLKNSPDYIRDMLIIAYNTGMRPGEIKLLKWPYIDWKAGFIRLPEGATKEKKQKNIPINWHVLDVLNRNKPALNVVDENYHDYVFSYHGKPILSPFGIIKAFKTVCKKSKIIFGKKVESGIILHEFRRSVKTNMVAARVDKVYRDTILGHSLQGMDVHYIKPTEADLKKAMDDYTQWLDKEIQFIDQTLTKKDLSDGDTCLTY